MHKKIITFLFLSLAATLVLSLDNAVIHIDVEGEGVGVGVWMNGQDRMNGQDPSPNSSPTVSPQNREFQALQAWKQAITEDPNRILSNWVGSNVCTYKGVYCSEPPDQSALSSPSSPSNVVAGIDLNKANLKGILVKELSLLIHLTFFHINTNRFFGTVPDSFSELQFLTELDLSNNQLSGLFPTVTILIPQLKFLDLRYNFFSSELPDELFDKNLDAIFLNNNRFEGDLPMSLWSSPASVITLANNNLTGTIPTFFGSVSSRAKELLLLNNKLTGCIPDSLGYLSDIEVLDLSFNSLGGHVPSSLSCLAGIQVLNIAHNELTGEVPDLLCDLKQLVNLTVSFNFFSGFSSDCTNLPVRNVWFDFVGNCIPGRDMQRAGTECTDVPDTGLSCLISQPVGCGTVGSGRYESPTLGFKAGLGPDP